MTSGGRAWLSRGALLGALLVAAILGFAPAASAHPLGNATVNHYDGLHLYPDHVSDQAVEDIAEIPTLQRKRLIDTDGNGTLSAAERASYAAHQCVALAHSERISVNGSRLHLTVTASTYSERPGAIQLRIGRLVCAITAPAGLSHDATLAIDSSWDSAGIGWHEITAAATGVTLHQSPFPATSISDTLLRYPNDMLSSPLDVRTGSITMTPGAGTSSHVPATALPVAGVAVRALNRLATAFNNLVGARHLTLGVGLLAAALSLLLGAGHAFLPGHGKTIMAAYLVGRRGRLRDVITVGATVTLTHTAGVLVLGLLISVTAAFAPTAAEQDLGIASGLIVTCVGVGLLVSAARRHRARTTTDGDLLDPGIDLTTAPAALAAGSDRPTVAAAAVQGAVSPFGQATATLTHDHPHPHDHDHPHGHPHSHDHPHGPGHGHGHPHGPGHGHPHGHPHQHGGTAEPRGFSRGGLVGLGVAGGLVPSPSALLVLLAAIALGRTAFGIVLVLGYGLGMATALTAAGLLLVQFRNRLSRVAVGRRLAIANRAVIWLPVLTASLVLLVGVGLTLRAVHGSV